MTDIIEHGARLLAMDDGWDGPDSKQPDKWVVLCGVMLLRVVIEAGYPTPILYPTHEGGMRAEWDCGTQTHNVSVDIGGERLYFHALDLLTDDFDELDVEWSQCQQVIDALKRTLVKPTT